MTKLNAKTIAWLKDTLTNDEVSTNEELIAWFITEGKLTQAEAEKWVNLRRAYQIGIPKTVAVLQPTFACAHCQVQLLHVVLHYKSWFLECSGCGNVLSEKEQHAYFMEPLWEVVTMANT
jgi:hypothetical protein